MFNKFCRWVILILIVFLGLACSQATQAPSPPARWFKGNLHTHSFWSDGEQFPEMVARIYQQLGYNFLALSEHNSISEGIKWIDINEDDVHREAYMKYLETFSPRWVETRRSEDKTLVRVKPFSEYRSMVEKPGEFLLIPAEEVTHKLAHFNLVNCVDLIEPVEGATAVEVLQQNIEIAVEQQEQTGQEMLVHINHPNWRWMLTAEDLMVQEAGFFELFNAGGTSINNFGDALRPGHERMWDIILTRRLAELDLPIMYGIATDDTHHYTGTEAERALPGRGWTMVRAHYLTPESIVKAMKAGDFYASSGVEINDIQFDGTTLKIDIKSKPGVRYTTEFLGTLKGYDPSSEPVLDENGQPYLDKDGNPLRITRTYSDDMGQILKTVKGSTASYTMTGDEIYVRATVKSDRLKSNYHVAGEYEVAWIQPVIPKSK